ncbi:MAG: 2-oxoglutarate dehydrogenase complex dihydrolipoyllysine-residue succinyltransferase [Desulfuromonadales bacterium]|nr:2-oxoglutarate dehydrogenase complex dihydrolipoyllysine-residue succinyltransferase [Desulfuromonadales bacterium]
MDIKVPEVGESIVEAVIGQWLVADGASVEEDDILLELETDKVNMEIPAEASGVLEILVAEGETVEIGAVIGRIQEGAAAPDESPAEKQQTAAPAPEKPVEEEPTAVPAEAEQSKAEEAPVNPAAAKLAAERGIDLSTIKGSGRDGRILVDDIPAAGAAPEQTAAPQKPEPASAPAPKAEPPKPGDDSRSERVPMAPIRKRIAERLLSVRQQTAMLTTFNEIDMQRVMQLRKNHQEVFHRKHGVKLGFMSFFVKACVESLKAFPAVNARIDGDDIVYQHFYDIGIAVSGKKGLVVPIIRDADRLHFAAIEKTIRDFGERAATNKLELSELQGGTFTISNGGIFGSVLSTPLLNPPQSGILGMHAIQDRPVVRDGQIVIRPIMNIALSYDHRIIDGREAVGFLKQVKTYIEDPEEMLLEL